MYGRETRLRNLQALETGMFLQGILHELVPRSVQGYRESGVGTDARLLCFGG